MVSWTQDLLNKKQESAELAVTSSRHSVSTDEIEMAMDILYNLWLT
jgi:hypothetical protein